MKKRQLFLGVMFNVLKSFVINRDQIFVIYSAFVEN